MSIFDRVLDARAKYFGVESIQNQSVPSAQERERMERIAASQRPDSILSRVQRAREKFFEPEPGKLRARDFYREVVGNLEKTRGFLKETGKAVLHAPQRSALSVAMQPVADIAKLRGKKVEAKFTPKTKLEKFLFGEDPVTGIFDQTDQAQEAINNYLGGRPEMEGVSIITAPLFVGGMVALDLLPVGGAGKQALKKSASRIAKLSKPDDVLKVLKTLFKDGDDTLIPLAGQLAKSTNEKQIFNTIRNITDAGTVAKPIKESAEQILERPKAQPVEEVSRRAQKYVNEKKPSFEVPEQTKIEYLQQQIQDKMQRLKRTQKEIVKTGKAIDDNLDAYLQQELFPGRAAERIDIFRRKVITTTGKQKSALMERLARAKFSLDDIGEYLFAKHAPERNFKVAEINPKFPDGGSGMTNKQAADIMAKYQKSGRAAELDRFSEEVYETITRDRLRILKESGLEKPETIKQLREAYQNYVPLKTDKGAVAGRGKGFTASGRNVFKARGSAKERNNPLIQAITDYEGTIIKAEKNKVAQSFLKLAQENPNPNLWEVNKLKFMPKFDKAGEIISFDPKFKFADNVIEARVDGNVHLITIHDKELAKAMKGLGLEKSSRLLNAANGFLRAVNTFFNPEFIITNFERDLQTALINIGGEQGVKAAKRVVKDVPRAMKGIWRNVRGKTDNEWSRLYSEMKEEGGRVGWFDHKSIEQKTNDLTKLANRYNSNSTPANLGKFMDGLGKVVVDANEVTESAVRLSAYKNAKAAGATKAKSAQLAKNLTVNFNKKGNWGAVLNGLYLFANAGIQGTARVITALKHPRTRKIVLGLIAGSYGLNEMNRIINEEEYNKIADFQKDTNFIMMMPNGNHLKVKLPYGYNIFKVFGDAIYDQVHGKKTVPENLKRLVLAADQAFNPLSSGDLAQVISPTLLDPIVQQASNKNWFGGPIKPDQPAFGAKKRESSLYFGSVRDTSKGVTEWLNKVTGGSEIEAGKIDVSPELVDHYIDFIGGGVGRFMANTFETGVNFAKGDLPDTKNMPFIRQMIGTPYEYYERGKLFELRDKSSTNELTEREVVEFKENIKNGLLADKITQEEAVNLIKDVVRNEARINAGKVWTEIKDADKTEKKKAIEQLDPMEQKEFIKILKKKAE